MNANEVLRAARARISKAERWTQGDFAKTIGGRPIGAREGGAACWCAAGALEAEVGFTDGAYEALEAALNALAVEMEGHIYSFNDNRSHADVLAAFDRAIEATKEPA